MAKNTQPIAKRCKALGISPAVMGYAKKNTTRNSNGNFRKKKSEYATQMQEKQKLKFIYGVLEKQFSNYFEEASRRQGQAGENLLQLLECRLDNVVFRLGYASTRRDARQLVLHGHFTVNGKKVNVVMAAVGDGGGSYYLPTADMTALVHEVWRGAIASKEINSKSSNMVDVKFVLPGTVGGFTAREAALIDDEGDMIAVCNLPDTEKAAIEDGIAAALTILMHIVMTNSDALTFTLDPTTDTASAVCVAFTIPHEAWQSAGGAEDDEGGGTYPCRADVVCDEATAMHTPIATLDKACLAAAKACELCPTVETASGVLRFWAMKVPDGELTGSVLLVGQGGGGKSGDGSYTLPTATPFRLGGVKVGDGLTVDNEGKLSVDAANTEETTGALNEVFGAEDGK